MLAQSTEIYSRTKHSLTTRIRFCRWYAVVRITRRPAFDILIRTFQQNIGWFLRKAIAIATITLTVDEYTDDDHKTHIDIAQRATGGISGTTEKRTLDWTWRDHTDGIFGSLKGRSRWCKLKEVDDEEWLKQGWDDVDGEFIQSYVESKTDGWTADQIWGFETMDDKKRYYCRRVCVRKGDDWKLARLVYDWQG